MAAIGIDIVRENYAALPCGDVPASLALCSPDITDYQSRSSPGQTLLRRQVGRARCGRYA